jgi:hypothetical protein
MAFLTKDDLLSEIYEEVLEAITRGNEGRIDTAVGLALGEAQNFLGIKYDVEDIYRKEGDERNKTVLRIVKDITIFRLYGVLESTPEDIQVRYDNARRDLELIAGTAPRGNTIPLVGCKLNDLDTEAKETREISYINRTLPRNNYF